MKQDAWPDREDWLRAHLVCPRDHEELNWSQQSLVCPRGHTYPVLNGIPVMLLEEVRQTHGVANQTLQQAANRDEYESNVKCVRGSDPSESAVHAHVQESIAATSGYLYRGLIGKLNTYPIPELRMTVPDDATFLDIGCNWGRWTIAAARKGFRPVGIDPSLNAVRAARLAARDCGVEALFVTADARYLPFRENTFQTAFSYSVLQHFSKEDLQAALREVHRVVKLGGGSLIQMPNCFGIRCIYHQARRGFRRGRDFEVRYFTPRQLLRVFERSVGPTQLSVDGFFGLGIQASDIALMPFKHRVVIRVSEWLRRLSTRIGTLVYLADSLYLRSSKNRQDKVSMEEPFA